MNALAITLSALTILTSLRICSHATGYDSNFQLIQPTESDCLCPGVHLVLECNVTGQGSTVYEGDFLRNCSNNALILLHNRYENGTQVSMCNDGDILARSIGSVNNTYSSLLRVKITVNTNIGKNISCIYDNGQKAVNIGNYTIQNLTLIAPLPPPKVISWKRVFSNMLVFQWNHVPSTCAAVKYNIHQLNCGHCPNVTVSPNVTCSNVSDNALSICMFSVQSVVCKNITGEWSKPISITKNDYIALRSAVIAGPAAATFTSVIILLGIVILSIILGIKRKNRLSQQQSVVSRDRTIQETNDRPKPKFHCVSSKDLGIHGYSLCESDYDNVTVSNDNYSRLDYNPCQDFVEQGKELGCKEYRKGEVLRGTGCIRHQDELLDLENVLVKLRGKVKGHWYQFGITIGVPKDILSQLFGYADEDCLIEILDYWIKNHPDQPTWKELADAMEDLGDYELATSILKVYNPHDKKGN